MAWKEFCHTLFFCWVMKKKGVARRNKRKGNFFTFHCKWCIVGEVKNGLKLTLRTNCSFGLNSHHVDFTASPDSICLRISSFLFFTQKITNKNLRVLLGLLQDNRCPKWKLSPGLLNCFPPAHPLRLYTTILLLLLLYKLALPNQCPCVPDVQFLLPELYHRILQYTTRNCQIFATNHQRIFTKQIERFMNKTSATTSWITANFKYNSSPASATSSECLAGTFFHLHLLSNLLKNYPTLWHVLSIYRNQRNICSTTNNHNHHKRPTKNKEKTWRECLKETSPVGGNN